MSLVETSRCASSADVLERARQVRALRRQMYRPRPAVPPPPPAPAPAPSEPLELPAMTVDVPPAPEISQPPPVCSDVRTLMTVAAEYFKISYIDLISERRRWPLVHYRQITMYVATIATPFSLPQIGRRMNRDHTTILHAQRKILAQRKSGDAGVITAITDLMAQLGVPVPPVDTGASRPRTDGRRWDEEEMQLLERYLAAGYSNGAIAEELNRTIKAVESKKRCLKAREAAE